MAYIRTNVGGAGGGGGGGAFTAAGDTTITPTTALLMNGIVGNEVSLSLAYDTNKTAGNDTGLLLDKTDTSSPGASYLADFQTGSVSKFRIGDDGNCHAAAVAPGTLSNFMGSDAGLANTSNWNTGIGNKTLANQVGNCLGSTGIGYEAGDTNEGSYLTAVGFRAAVANEGDQFTAIGYFAGHTNTKNQCTAVGGYALYQNTGSLSCAVGYYAGFGNTGTTMTAMGDRACNGNSGTFASGFGHDALENNSGARCTALGYSAGTDNSGDDLTAGGYSACFLNSGINNAGFGTRSLGSGVTGANNVGVGHNSGYYQAGGTSAVTTMDASVFVGATTKGVNLSTLTGTTGAFSALVNNATVLVGDTTINLDDVSLTGIIYQGNTFTVAGDSQVYRVTGDKTAATNAITALPFEPAARVAWADDAVVTVGSSAANQIVLGYAAESLGANTAVLGNSSIATTVLRGSVGVGTTTPNANSVLDLTSTTKAFMPPRMTTTQKNAVASPTAGMVVYDSTLSKLAVYTGAGWEAVTSV